MAIVGTFAECLHASPAGSSIIEARVERLRSDQVFVVLRVHDDALVPDPPTDSDMSVVSISDEALAALNPEISSTSSEHWVDDPDVLRVRVYIDRIRAGRFQGFLSWLTSQEIIGLSDVLWKIPGVIVTKAENRPDYR